MDDRARDPAGGPPLSVLSPAMRAISGLLVAISRGSLPALAVASVTVLGGAAPLALLVQAIAALSLLPGIAAALLVRAGRVSLEASARSLVVETGGGIREIPFSSIASVEAWRLPLPRPGLTLGLGPQSDRIRIASADLVSLLGVLARADVRGARRAATSPAVVHAAVRRAHAARWLGGALAKFGLFPLLPAAILFRAHQHITWGGSFGQARLAGWSFWLSSLATEIASVAIALLLYASVLRALAEVACFAAASVAPPRAAAVRHLTETAVLLAYYAGVPAFLAVVFLA
ncbi:hypothetical protein MYXO_02198 [Myxococcaceae bacterium]|jgi:hypothetical protein|nr:hypothetical protein MYXO_02198 [Myxococcaceae bacterium]